MPYGIKDETKEQTKFMEGCIGKISGTNNRTDKPYTKGEKIAICKVQLKKKGTSEAYSEESLREKYWDFEDKIREALHPHHDHYYPSYGPYVEDVFEDYVIVGVEGGKTYKLPYTMDGDDVSFDWSEAVEVERKTVYEPVGAEREVVTKVPRVGVKDGGRVRTIGGRTIN